MNLNRLLENEKNNFISLNNKSYYIYKYSLIILGIPSIISLPFGLKVVYNYIDFISTFTTPLLLIAFLIDLYYIIRLLWGKIYGKILYSIFGYFAYIKATVYAKNIIYFNTGANPDVFQNSINYIAGWLLIPAWIIQINIVLTILVIFLGFLPQILFIFKDFFEPLLKKIEYQITYPIKKYIGKNIIIHILFFIMGAGIFNLYVFKISYKIYDYSCYNIVREKIKENSYYINNNITCNNQKILSSDYIKLIGDNIVSIARTDSKGNITFNKENCN